MPIFGIRYIDYRSAHPLDGSKPLPYEQWAILPDYEFTTFNEAKSWAERETAVYTRNRYNAETHQYAREPETFYMAYKIPLEQNHVTREKARQDAGEYELLPSNMHPGGGEVTDYIYFYPRLIKDEDENIQIGYYENMTDARMDRLTKVKPTKYFMRWFTEDVAWEHMATLGIVGAGVHLVFVNTREDIRYVYENGPASCMSENAGRYYSEEVHPVEAYASPDLELAVLVRGGSDIRASDALVARALCNKHTKEYVRIYGDIKRMEKLLDEQGYSLNSFCLGGCKLLKIFGSSKGKERNDIIMTPYLDGACNRMKLANQRDEYMEIIAEERIITGSTSGYANIGG